MSTPAMNTKLDDVIGALADVHDEATLWRLSDELVKVAPSGVKAVEEVVAEAKRRGIATKSANTLRLYRDVAIRFPVAERIGGVSFSAHREAIAIGDATKAGDVLRELVAKHGAANVTVTTVKSAIGATTGKVKAAPAVKAAGTTYDEVARDLAVNGGAAFIAAIDAMLDVKGVSLDSLHVGLSKVLANVENRRAKAARKAAAPAVKAVDPAKSPAAARAKRAAAAASKAPAKRVASKGKPGVKAGDIRDL